MSHFTVLVVGKDYEEQLAPYSENLEVDEYVNMDIKIATKKRNKAIKEYKEILSLPKEKKVGYNIEFITKELESLSKKTNKEYLNDNLYEKADKKRGYSISTYNPNSKWDWYEVGGRWCGYFKLKEGKAGVIGESGVGGNKPKNDADIALKGDIDGEIEPTFAVVKDGKWYEKGNMGWWGTVRDEKETDKWEKEFKKLIDNIPDSETLVLLDCHI